LNISADQLEFDIYDNPRGKPNCQGKIAYRGPVSPTSGGWPKIKLDLTADERLVLPSVRREAFHPYGDKPEGGIWANCYAYEEGEHGSYRVDRMQVATVTSQVFTPRYSVELTSTGPLAVAPTTAIPRMLGMRRAAITRHEGPTYVYRLHRLCEDF
jgi:hypothetical protein